MSCAHFHAVNIPQERRECMCFKCNHKTKPVKTATSDYLYSRGAFESLHEQGDIQILVIQRSILTRTGESNVNEHGLAVGEITNPLETSTV